MHKKESFNPVPFFRDNFSQTILGTLFNVNLFTHSETQYVKLSDGDQLAMEVTTPTGWKETDPTVMLVHGLCGSHRSPYLIRLTRRLLKKGIRAVRFNLRGCGSGRGLAKRFYHCGLSGDIQAGLAHLKKAIPNSPTILIGFSLGGNLVLKLAGELREGAKDYMDEVYAVSPPIELVSSMRLLSHPDNKLFERYFLKHLLSDVEYLETRFPDVEKMEFPEDLTILDFDELYIAPRIGYSSAFDYYKASSAINVVPNIKIPCKILFAEDDPIINPDDIDKIPLPEQVEVFKTDRGGHLGFLGMPNQGYGFRWMDGLLMSWVRRFQAKLVDREE